MLVPITIACVLLGADPTIVDPDVSALLAERADAARGSSVVRRLEVIRAARRGDLAVAEALLRARKFLADGLRDEDRATALHRENVQDGLRAISSVTGRELRDFGALLDAWSELPPAAVGVVYWTTLSYGRTIPDRFLFSRPAAAVRFREALERLVEWDPTYFHAGPLRALASFEARAPGFLGGDRDRGVRRAREAVRRAADFAPNHVALARALLACGGERSRAAAALERAREDSTSPSEADVPEHRRGQAAARALTARLRAGTTW